jgi:hypothetical protein
VQRKVARISEALTNTISAWETVEAIVLGESAEIKLLDPYFTISLDVYFTGVLYPRNDRREQFGAPRTFDTVPGFTEDRFLVEELPVRIRYQETTRIEFLLKRIGDGEWVFHEAGTHPFYRLAHGQVLFHRSDWLESIRRRLGTLPDHYWQMLRDGARIATSYYLNDLRAATYRSDSLFVVFSLSRFLQNLCGFLFAVNRSFEPSPRLMMEKVVDLPRLPDGFRGRFESLLREGPDLTVDRRAEIAELLTKSILAMS